MKSKCQNINEQRAESKEAVGGNHAASRGDMNINCPLKWIWRANQMGKQKYDGNNISSNCPVMSQTQVIHHTGSSLPYERQLVLHAQKSENTGVI